MRPAVTLAGARWRKSSASLANGNCAEVAAQPGIVAVRDSQDPDGPVLVVAGSTWGAFCGRLKRGET
jgi:hypothetical protein